MVESYCINHSDRVATARCRQCGKPLCDECKKITKEGIFCSEKCHERAKAFSSRMEEIEDKRWQKRKGIPGPIKGFLKFLIFVLIIWIILHFGLKINNLSDLRNLVSSGINKIQLKK